MKYLQVAMVVLLVSVPLLAEELIVDVPAPEHQLVNGTLTAEGVSFINPIGAPNLPCRKVTIALPPGAIVESVDFSGDRYAIGSATIEPLLPMLPMSGNEAFANVMSLYRKKRNEYYSYDVPYPHALGAVLCRGGIRKYTVVDIACYHFAYRTRSHTLLYTPRITMRIEYRMPAQGSARELFWNSLKDDVTFDSKAETVIYNWEQAKEWYRTGSPKRANGYFIIIPSSLVSSVDSLVSYRQSQGYDVQVITKEYIETNYPGDDLPQKIRNYLRTNLPDIMYVLLVGFSSDMRWRSLVPFNNDPDSPWNNYEFSPIPSDLYYAELTDHDTLSWNSDRDSYYGEVFDENFQLVGDDDPDYHADICVGRIPFSFQSYIQDICNKIIAFDCNTDLGYKTGSLIAGALYYYANEDSQGNQRNDGADYCEALMDDSVLDRSNAIYLYEKAGLRPCQYPCTDSLTRTNLIANWQNKGIMYECHHGHNYLYARKVWYTDDGDSVPEANEMWWPASLQSNDVYQLDNTHPATSVLRSCLCGNPDVEGLGSLLLYRGSSSVISSSRVCWMTHADAGGIPHHFFDRLMLDTLASQGIIGDAYDLARTDFMNNTMFWLPAYHYNLFGDPALRQYGRLAGIEETDNCEVRTGEWELMCSPNPFHDKTEIRLLGEWGSGRVGDGEIKIYDVSGRKVRHFILYPCAERSRGASFFILPAELEWDGRDENGELMAPGVYFCVLKTSDRTARQKILLVR
jgi:hypothetical protein